MTDFKGNTFLLSLTFDNRDHKCRKCFVTCVHLYIFYHQLSSILFHHPLFGVDDISSYYYQLSGWTVVLLMFLKSLILICRVLLSFVSVNRILVFEIHQRTSSSVGGVVTGYCFSILSANFTIYTLPSSSRKKV